MAFFEAALFLLILSAPCLALNVSGLPGWLEPVVLRSLSAVWAEIPEGLNVDREGTLRLVARRLFAGYEIETAKGRDGEPLVRFIARDRTRWEVRAPSPELRGMAAGWFSSDIRGIEEEVAALLRTLPGAALTWADGALKEALASIVEKRIPGWEFSVQIALGGSEGTLTLSFRPGPPLVLALNPALSSRTLPVMFRSDLEAKLIQDLSPLIGLPVAWAGYHRGQVEAAAQAFLEDRHAVENLRARVDVVFVPGAVSGLDVQVDSSRFLFQVWVAAYAGLEGRYPEAGVFFGWNTAHLTGLDVELYAEGIMALDDFGWNTRLGARAQLLQGFWAGVERAWPEDEWFYRLQWGGSRVRRPYLWWRWSPDAGHEGAVGYRVDQHISIEVYYDGTGSDKVGVRGLWSL
ncbi:MAG: hypothetical protein IJ702_02410 [Fretibacterium sp.]|nr:hypothetical protein [Fretibacterium sp.]